MAAADGPVFFLGMNKWRRIASGKTTLYLFDLLLLLELGIPPVPPRTIKK